MNLRIWATAFLFLSLSGCTAKHIPEGTHVVKAIIPQGNCEAVFSQENKVVFTAKESGAYNIKSGTYGINLYGKYSIEPHEYFDLYPEDYTVIDCSHGPTINIYDSHFYKEAINSN